jgi:FecR-like protein
MIRVSGFARVFTHVLAMVLVLGAAAAANTEEARWSVSKSSGEVWIATAGAQPVSLDPQGVLKPGDSIRTGRNGRVLLVRGEESILVAPNSVIGLPTESKDGLSTTIMQQAGSILLEVEKRNVRHFSVETPYLAAVVKGTQFRVSVNAASTSVDVIRGQVEVADFRSGQVAQVMPGQVATASARGTAGLSLTGSGTFSPIERGQPRASTIQQIMVPKSGLSAPRHAANGQPNRGRGHGDRTAAQLSSRVSQQPQGNAVHAGHGVTRITASLGEVRLNFHKVTHGLAHGANPSPGSTRSAVNKDTIWTSRETAARSGAGNSSGNSNDGGGAAGSNAATMSGATGATIAVTAAVNDNGNGKANGNGNDNGHVNGNGSGNANGHNRK